MALDDTSFERVLLAHGFRVENAADKADTLARIDAALTERGASSVGRVTVWAPGRIEVFGKHTDYAGGRSLLTAVDRGFCLRAARRADRMIHVHALDTALTCTTALDVHAAAPEGHWSNYVATVARRVALNFPDAVTGVDIVFSSDLPLAAGVSSSTALMMSVFFAIAAVNRLHESRAWSESIDSRAALAGYLGAMEMGGAFAALAGLDGVGTLGGSQDQTAILCAEAGRIVDFAWMPVRPLGSVSLPDTHLFVVASSGVFAEKSAGARDQYNRASLMVTHLLAAWNRHAERSDRSLAQAMESAPAAADQLRGWIAISATDAFPAVALRHRLEQFLLETYTLIPAAARALAEQDWDALAELVARSQSAAEEMLGNQIAETSGLVRLAKAHGAIAASAFGAGFGGSVWALISADAENTFSAAWSAGYREEFPERASDAMFFSSRAGPGAACWIDDVRIL